ncbi:MAG: glycine cleavage system aminomethyltransferase GcvT [Proteobacteria bacterium]|nr:glycine cleavage system aminomethyltransferase GcvT [Pseudomonadota bacterium]MCP4921948.1 glycine cleavage system aminomethyltransferase GcvT [Pseudomonadota bacterium]
MKETVFHDQHVASGAKMVDFGGWHMPVSYSGTLAEHAATRTSVGLFDVSHMGELRVKGPNALAALQHLVSNDVSKLPVGQSQYAALMRPDGGIVDDLFVYRLADDDYLVCINAGNRGKDWAYFLANNPHDAELVNESDVWAQVAIQGRNGPAVTQSLTSVPVMDLERGAIVEGDFAGVEGCLLARTGYTGEDGFEVFIPVDEAEPTWQRILASGHDIVQVGLGARDTLRLEAKNVLYGNDILDTTSPLEAGLGWITKLGKGDFLGRDALVAQKANGLPRRLVGLVVDKRIARPHCPILNADGEVIGEVTSGSRSPTLGTNIALGYVKAERGNAKPGNVVQIDIRGRITTATVVKGPFWSRDY